MNHNAIAFYPLTPDNCAMLLIDFRLIIQPTILLWLIVPWARSFS